MTPAERLLAAADLLDKRAGEATGDWEVDDDNHLALVSIITPLSVRTSNAGGRYSFTGPDDATTHYIATMHPEVGKAVAAILRTEVQRLKHTEMIRAFGGAPLFKPHAEALALADLLLAGES